MGRRRKGKATQSKISPDKTRQNLDKNTKPHLGRSKDKTIRLHVIGPKRLLPEAKTIEAKLSSTWYKVLRQELDLKFTPEQGIFVCSVGYTPGDERGRQNGWRADLNETVKQYISKFEMSRKQYTVKLSDPNIFNTVTPRTLENLRLRRALTSGPEPAVDREGGWGEAAGGRFRRALTPGPEVSHERGKGTVGGRMRRALTPGPEVGREASGSVRLRNRGPPAPVVANNGRKRHASLNQQQSTGLNRQLEETWRKGFGASEPQNNGKRAQETPMKSSVDKVNIWLSKQGQDSSLGKFWDERGLEDEDSDGASLDTTASEEEEELRSQGIRVENIKPQVEARTAQQVNNSFMLRVKNEIAKLRRKNLWIRNVQRSPLACRYLEVIFGKNQI